MKTKTIYTIGHSTHSIEEFIEMLQSFKIEILIDIRRFPGSKKYPQFNQENLKKSLQQNGIDYVHLLELGGRRKPKKDSKNTAWRVDAFRAYADYMETDEFKSAIEALELIANKKRSAIMCSEAVWWRCHRSLVSDYLKFNGWKVLHIMTKKSATEHPFTKAANLENGILSYEKTDD